MSQLLDKINKVEYNVKQWRSRDSAIPSPDGLREPGGSMRSTATKLFLPERRGHVVTVNCQIRL